jgi:hypothetical protein
MLSGGVAGCNFGSVQEFIGGKLSGGVAGWNSGPVQVFIGGSQGGRGWRSEFRVDTGIYRGLAGWHRRNSIAICSDPALDG